MFTDWMIQCGHQIGCAVHDGRGVNACDCSARNGVVPPSGAPSCGIPHVVSSSGNRAVAMEDICPPGEVDPQ